MRPLGFYMIMGTFSNFVLYLLTFIHSGADVGHPGAGTQKPSVTSFVYSWDQYAAKYAAMCGIQQPRQEIIEDFRQYVKSAISSFVQVNGRNVPASIFFFRDGVSEGEYQTVSKHERDELQGIFLVVSFGNIEVILLTCISLAAIDELWAEHRVRDPKPKITFVIVTKR